MAKNSKRKSVKYPNLVPGYNVRNRQYQIDFDYLDQLNDEELAWLDKFVSEEINASFKKDGTDINTTDEQRRQLYTMNNRRNFDVYSLNKAGSAVLTDEEKSEGKTTLNLWQSRYDSTADLNDEYVEFIEKKQIDQMLEDYSNFMLALKDDE